MHRDSGHYDIFSSCEEISPEISINENIYITLLISVWITIEKLALACSFNFSEYS